MPGSLKEAKSCLLFVNPAGPGSLKESQKVFIVCLSGRAWNFKRRAKSCLLIVYWAGPGSLLGRAGKFERQKVISCLFIRQGQKV